GKRGAGARRGSSARRRTACPAGTSPCRAGVRARPRARDGTPTSSPPGRRRSRSRRSAPRTWIVVASRVARMVDRIRVEPGHKPKIADRNPRDTLGLGDKEHAKEKLAELQVKLEDLHQRLFAEARRGLLLVLQGLDASGKDGVVRAVMQGVNPQGCRV